VHRVVRGILIFSVRDHITMFVLVVPVVVVIVTVPWRARLAFRFHHVQSPDFEFLFLLRRIGRLDRHEGIILWGVFAVEVVVLGFSCRFVNLVLGTVVVGVRVNGVLVGTSHATSIVGGQELVHRVVRGILIFSVRDHITMFVLVVPVVVVIVTVPWRARLAFRFHHVQSSDFELLFLLRRSGRPDRHEGVILWGVLAVEVVVLSLSCGFVNLVLRPVVVGVRVHGVLVGTGHATPVVRGKELVHRVVRGILILGVRYHVPVLVLVVIVVVGIPVPWRARLAPSEH